MTYNIDLGTARPVWPRQRGTKVSSSYGLETVIESDLQQLEPSHVAVTPDESRAYINCQVNNALLKLTSINWKPMFGFRRSR